MDCGCCIMCLYNYIKLSCLAKGMSAGFSDLFMRPGSDGPGRDRPVSDVESSVGWWMLTFAWPPRRGRDAPGRAGGMTDGGDAVGARRGDAPAGRDIEG